MTTTSGGQALSQAADGAALLLRTILDVESLLLIHRLVTVDRLGARSPRSAVVELRGHARLALVLAPGDHADPGISTTVGLGSRIPASQDACVCCMAYNPCGIELTPRRLKF